MSSPIKLSLPIFQNHKPEGLIVNITGRVDEEDQLASRVFKLGEEVTLVVEGYVASTQFKYNRDSMEFVQVVTVKAEAIQDARDVGGINEDAIVEVDAADATTREPLGIARASTLDADTIHAAEARLVEVSHADPYND